MSKDRAPKEILKDKRSLADKAMDLLREADPSDKEIKAFIRKFKARNQGNPEEAGALIAKDSKLKGITGQPQQPRMQRAKSGGLMEATAKLKAKGFSEGGAVKKDKTVAMDKSPNSGLITQRGFGASRRT
jgi:hypothetical protein